MDQLLGPVKVSPVRQGRNTHHHRAMTEETGDVRGVQRVLLTFSVIPGSLMRQTDRRW